MNGVKLQKQVIRVINLQFRLQCQQQNIFKRTIEIYLHSAYFYALYFNI